MQYAKQVAKQATVSTNFVTLILRYVSKSHRKEGESPFNGVVNGEGKGKIIRNANEASSSALKGSVTLPTQKVYQQKMCRHPLPGFVSSS